MDDESQEELALSTHHGVLSHQRRPFGIKSALYFQEIIEKLTAELLGVAVYLDDILVSGCNAADHPASLSLLQWLEEKGLH